MSDQSKEKKIWNIVYLLLFCHFLFLPVLYQLLNITNVIVNKKNSRKEIKLPLDHFDLNWLIFIIRKDSLIEKMLHKRWSLLFYRRCLHDIL